MRPPVAAGAPIQIYRGRTYVDDRPARRQRALPYAVMLLRSPGPYHARYGRWRSPARAIQVTPAIETSLEHDGRRRHASSLLRARVVPAAAGTLRTRVLRERRLVATRKGVGAAADRPSRQARRSRCCSSHGAATASRGPCSGRPSSIPRFRSGAQGPSVLALERRLRELHYALRAVDSTYGYDTFEAVLAFQKVHWLPRTGRVEPWLWKRLASCGRPARRTRRRPTSRSTRPARCCSTCGTDGSPAPCTSRPARQATRRSARGTSTARSAAGTGCSGTRCTSCAASRSTATRPCPRIPPRTAASASRCGSAPTLYSAHGYGTTVFVH